MKDYGEVMIESRDGKHELFLYGVIGDRDWGGVDSRDVIAALADIPKGEPLTVRINTVGGAVDHGQAIYAALKRRGNVGVAIDGFCMSIGTLIALAGDPVTMAEHGLFMVHRAWSATVGNTDDHTGTAGILGKIDAQLVGAYSARTGKSAEDVAAMMKAETFLTPSEALEAGFLDAIDDGDGPDVTVAGKAPAEYRNDAESLLKMNAEQVNRDLAAAAGREVAGQPDERTLGDVLNGRSPLTTAETLERQRERGSGRLLDMERRMLALGTTFDPEAHWPNGDLKPGSVKPQSLHAGESGFQSHEDVMNTKPKDAPRATGHRFETSDGVAVQAFAARDRMSTPEPGRLGAALQDVLRGRGVRNEVVTHADSDGGFVVSKPDTARLLDLVRAASVATRAGAQVLPMNAGGMTFGTIESDPVAEWRPEGAKVNASDITFGRIDLRPKTLAAIVPATIEWAEDATNGAALIESALTSALAAELDRAILLGDGTDAEPLGLFNHPNVPSTGSIGTPDGYGEIVTAVGDIYGRDYAGEVGSLSWVRHPRDAKTYAGLTDTTGQPLNAPEWAMGLQKYQTTKLPADGGAGDDESLSIIGDFSEVVVGMRTTIQIRVARDARVTDLDGNVHNAADELKLAFIAYLRADVAVLRPTFFQKLTGITAA